MERKQYPTDLSDAQWEIVYGAMPLAKGGRTGTLKAVHAALREQVRRKAGRESTPSATIVDSQSVRVAEKRGDAGATMPASGSPDANANSSPTRSG